MSLIALIGTGRIGQMHAAHLAELVGADRLILADQEPGRAAQVAQRLGCAHAEMVDDLWQRQDVGAVVITAATPAHAELITAAAAHDLPTFCEKPIAPRTAQAVELINALGPKAERVQIGFHRRVDPAYAEAKRAFEAGELGWIHTVRGSNADRSAPPAEFIARSGGIFRDCAVHEFDVMPWILGQRITQVYAQGSNNGPADIKQAGDVDSATVLITFADGTVGSLALSRFNGAGQDARLEVQGSKGSVFVGLDAGFPARPAEEDGWHPEGPAHPDFASRFKPAFMQEMRHFVAFAEGRGPNPCTLRQALAASAVADAAQESLETGKPVTVEYPAEAEAAGI